MKGRSSTPINYGPDGRTIVSRDSQHGHSQLGSPLCEICIRTFQEFVQQSLSIQLSNPSYKKQLQRSPHNVPSSLLDALHIPPHTTSSHWLPDGRCTDCSTPLIQLKTEAVTQSLPRQIERPSSAPGRSKKTSKIPQPSSRAASVKSVSSAGSYHNRQTDFTSTQMSSNIPLPEGFYASGTSQIDVANWAANQIENRFPQHQHQQTGDSRSYSSTHQSRIGFSPSTKKRFEHSPVGDDDVFTAGVVVERRDETRRRQFGSAAQLATAKAFFERASQPMDSPKKSRRHSADNADDSVPHNRFFLNTFRFSDVIHTLLPPPPTLQDIQIDGFDKMKVVLLARSSDPGKSTCFTTDSAKSLVHFHDPSHQFTAPSQRRAGSQAPNNKSFKFDKVFNDNEPMANVCAASLLEPLHSVLNGNDSCLFSIGYSKLGKTLTMTGHDSRGQYGIIPFAIAWLYKLVDEKKSSGDKISLRVSVAEIYGKEENVIDLLANVPNDPGGHSSISPGSHLRDDFICKQLGVKDLRAPTAKKAAYYLDEALAARSCLPEPQDNQMSHFLFTFHIYKLGAGGSNEHKVSLLHLIDLGSGRPSTVPSELPTKALSLHEIVSVIQSILSGQSTLPFKESKLDKMLKNVMNPSRRPSLCMIAHLSTSGRQYQKSLHLINAISKMKEVRYRPFSTSHTASSSSRSSTQRRLRMGIPGSSTSEFDSGSEQSVITVINRGPKGDALSTDDEGHSRFMPCRARFSSLTGTESMSDSSQVTVSSASQRTCRRSPQMGKMATTKAAIKNAGNALATGREQWVDGPNAVYTPQTSSDVPAEVASKPAPSTTSLLQQSKPVPLSSQQQRLQTSNLSSTQQSSTINQSKLPILNVSHLPSTHQTPLSNLSQSTSHGVFSESKKESGSFGQHNNLEKAQSNRTQELVHSSPLMIEPSRSFPDPDPDSDTGGENKNRALSCITERTEDTESITNGSGSGLEDDVRQDGGVALANMSVDEIEVPPVHSIPNAEQRELASYHKVLFPQSVYSQPGLMTMPSNIPALSAPQQTEEIHQEADLLTPTRHSQTGKKFNLDVQQPKGANCSTLPRNAGSSMRNDDIGRRNVMSQSVTDPPKPKTSHVSCRNKSSQRNLSTDHENRIFEWLAKCNIKDNEIEKDMEYHSSANLKSSYCDLAEETSQPSLHYMPTEQPNVSHHYDQGIPSNTPLHLYPNFPISHLPERQPQDPTQTSAHPVQSTPQFDLYCPHPSNEPAQVFNFNSPYPFQEHSTQISVPTPVESYCRSRSTSNAIPRQSSSRIPASPALPVRRSQSSSGSQPASGHVSRSLTSRVPLPGHENMSYTEVRPRPSSTGSGNKTSASGFCIPISDQEYQTADECNPEHSGGKQDKKKNNLISFFKRKLFTRKREKKGVSSEPSSPTFSPRSIDHAPQNLVPPPVVTSDVPPRYSVVVPPVVSGNPIVSPYQTVTQPIVCRKTTNSSGYVSKARDSDSECSSSVAGGRNHAFYKRHGQPMRQSNSESVSISKATPPESLPYMQYDTTKNSKQSSCPVSDQLFQDSQGICGSNNDLQMSCHPDLMLVTSFLPSTPNSQSGNRSRITNIDGYIEVDI